jgi:hypothetical protein
VAMLLVERGVETARVADLVDARADELAAAPNDRAVTEIAIALAAPGAELPTVAERWLRDRRDAVRTIPNPLVREFVNPFATGGRR